LDLPEVSLVAILDADKEGFLRSHRSLTQTAGRAARNLNGKVLMYADKITDSMAKTIAETNRRREKQLAYNEKHDITPTAIIKGMRSALSKADPHAYIEPDIKTSVAADPVVQYMSAGALERAIQKTKKAMFAAAKEMDFLEAARLRDEMLKMEEKLRTKHE
jgi:excinuclease ABC subunit B